MLLLLVLLPALLVPLLVPLPVPLPVPPLLLPPLLTLSPLRASVPERQPAGDSDTDGLYLSGGSRPNVTASTSLPPTLCMKAVGSSISVALLLLLLLLLLPIRSVLVSVAVSMPHRLASNIDTSTRTGCCPCPVLAPPPPLVAPSPPRIPLFATSIQGTRDMGRPWKEEGNSTATALMPGTKAAEAAEIGSPVVAVVVEVVVVEVVVAVAFGLMR